MSRRSTEGKSAAEQATVVSDFRRWSAEQVADWLAAQGYGHYRDKVLEWNLSGKKLALHTRTGTSWQ